MSTTITLILSVIAIAVSIFNFVNNKSINKEISDMTDGLKECASRVTRNKVSLETVHVSQLHLENTVKNSIKKRKPGRPKKSGK